MLTVTRLATLLVVAILLNGCVPIPNLLYYAPAVSGMVVENGTPVEGAEVHVSGKFADEIKSVKTSSDGRFSVEPIRKLLFTASLIGDPLYAYSVRIVVADKRYDAYVEAGVGPAPRELELACDLSQSVKLGNRKVYCKPTTKAR